MLKLVIAIAASAVLALGAAPAMAQDEPEEPRTTYRVVLLELNQGANDRWEEIMANHMIPARRAAGLPLPTIHWIMAGGDYSVMIFTEMREGMADLDTHGSAGDEALGAALLAQLGSDEAVAALLAEQASLAGDRRVIFTHTHP